MGCCQNVPQKDHQPKNLKAQQHKQEQAENPPQEDNTPEKGDEKKQRNYKNQQNSSAARKLNVRDHNNQKQSNQKREPSSSEESSLEDDESDLEVWQKPSKQVVIEVDQEQKSQKHKNENKRKENKKKKIVIDKKQEKPIELEDVKIIESSGEEDHNKDIRKSISKQNRGAESLVKKSGQKKDEQLVKQEKQKEVKQDKKEILDELEVNEDPQSTNSFIQQSYNKKARTNIFNKRRPENMPQEKEKVAFNPIEEVSKQPESDPQLQLIRQKPKILQFQTKVVQQLKELNKESLQKLKKEFQITDEQFLPAIEQIKIVKEEYQLNLIHLAIQNKDFTLVKYLLEDLRLKISFAIPKFQGDNLTQQNENNESQQNAQQVMLTLLEHIDIKILQYLLSAFSPLLEWDVVTYFMTIAVNLQDQERKKKLFKCFLQCDFVKSLLLSIPLQDRFVWFSSLLSLTGIQEDNITFEPTKQVYEIQGIEDEMILELVDSINTVFHQVQNIENFALQEKENILNMILDQDLETLKDEKYQDIIKYFIANYLFEDEEIDEAKYQNLQKGSRKYFTPILLCILIRNKDILNYLFETTKCNFFSLLTIPENTKLQMPLYTLFDYLMSTNNFEYFKFFYENPLTSYYILTQEMVQNLIFLIVQRNFTDKAEAYIELILKSPVTHYLFQSLNIIEKIQFVESILQARGTALTQLLEYMEYNIQEDERQSFYIEKNGKLTEIFLLIYQNLSQQPYALFFFKIFPEAIVQLKLEEDLDILYILENSRENIQDNDYQTFLWHQPEFSVKVIKNYSTDKETETTSLGQIIAIFIQNLIQQSDQALLKRYAPDIGKKSNQRREGGKKSEQNIKSQVQNQSSIIKNED